MRFESYASEIVETMKAISETLKKKNDIKVPISSIAYKGILLMHSTKGAAVLGFERGRGMVFKILETLPDGTPKLSPPVLVKISKIAVGLQLGFNSVYSLMLLPDDAQLEGLVRESETILGKDFEVSGYPGVNSDNITTFHRSSMTAVTDGVHIKPAIIQATDSFMVCDMSLYGGSLSVDHEAMLATYGDTYAGPIPVLRGEMAPRDSYKERLEEINGGFAKLAAFHVA